MSDLFKIKKRPETCTGVICPDAIVHRMCNDPEWAKAPCAIRDSKIREYKIRRLELICIALGFIIIIFGIATIHSSV